jgi:hypothetical protein
VIEACERPRGVLAREWRPQAPPEPCRVEPILTRDPGRDEIRPPHLLEIARRRTGSRAGRAATTRDARHSEGNYQFPLDDLKERTDADADSPHRIAYKKLVRA